MLKRRPPFLALLVLALMVGSCRKTDSPTDPGGSGDAPTPDVSLSVRAADNAPTDGDTTQITLQVTNNNVTNGGQATGGGRNIVP